METIGIPIIQTFLYLLPDIQTFDLILPVQYVCVHVYRYGSSFGRKTAAGLCTKSE